VLCHAELIQAVLSHARLCQAVPSRAVPHQAGTGCTKLGLAVLS